MIGRTRQVTSPIWSRTDWLASPKTSIVVLSCVELKMDHNSSLKTLFTAAWEEETPTSIDYFVLLTHER